MSCSGGAAAAPTASLRICAGGVVGLRGIGSSMFIPATRFLKLLGGPLPWPTTLEGLFVGVGPWHLSMTGATQRSECPVAQQDPVLTSQHFHLSIYLRAELVSAPHGICSRGDVPTCLFGEAACRKTIGWEFPQLHGRVAYLASGMFHVGVG